VSPNFNVGLADQLLQYQNLSSTYWKAQNFETSNPIYQVFLTEKDKSWFDEKIGIKAPVVNSFFEVSNPKNSFNGTVIIGKIPAQHYYIIYFVGSDYVESNSSNWKWKLATMATHEYQHLVQFHFTLTTPGINLLAELPCWFNEGMASKYEDALYLQGPNSSRLVSSLQDSISTEKWILENRDFRLRVLFNSIDSQLKVNSRVNWRLNEWAEFIESNYRIDSAGCSQHRYGYTLGNLLFEKLQIDFGSTKILDLLAQLKLEKSWTSAFQKIIGVSDLDWLKQTGIPYFIKEISK